MSIMYYIYNEYEKYKQKKGEVQAIWGTTGIQVSSSKKVDILVEIQQQKQRTKTSPF